VRQSDDEISFLDRSFVDEGEERLELAVAEQTLVLGLLCQHQQQSGVGAKQSGVQVLVYLASASLAEPHLGGDLERDAVGREEDGEGHVAAVQLDVRRAVVAVLVELGVEVVLHDIADHVNALGAESVDAVELFAELDPNLAPSGA